MSIRNAIKGHGSVSRWMTFLSDQKNFLSSPNIGDTMQVTKYAWFPTWVSKPDSLVWLKIIGPFKNFIIRINSSQMGIELNDGLQFKN